jgi:hypothetical protein
VFSLADIELGEAADGEVREELQSLGALDEDLHQEGTVTDIVSLFVTSRNSS